MSHSTSIFSFEYSINFVVKYHFPYIENKILSLAFAAMSYEFISLHLGIGVISTFSYVF